MNATAQVQAIRSQQSTERQATLSREANMTEQLTAYSQRQQAQIAELEACRMMVGEAEARLITAESERQSQTRTQRSLAQSLKSAEQLTAKLVADLEGLRTRALTADRRRVELDERLAELDSQLQVADAVQRALREENAQYKRDQRTMELALQEYTNRFGEIASGGLSQDEGIAPDRNLEAVVLDVTRMNDRTMVEIDVGSREGVQKGWLLTVGNGGTFIGRLRIIEVDLNRSTGILSLETESRGLAKPGHKAYALAGQG